jgi:carbamoyl-phosphate synthase small subunit
MQNILLESSRSMEETRFARAVLALEDGMIFEGQAFGMIESLHGPGRRGEVVFTTAMTGYQEVCTDPSYRGQMVVMTYPLIGNYGIASIADESRRPWLSVLIVREYCDEYSNWRAEGSLDAFLRHHGIPGLCEIDTRALTRHLRDNGTKRGVVRVLDPEEELNTPELIAAAQQVRTVTELDVVDEVSIDSIIRLSAAEGNKDEIAGISTKQIVLIDTGYKQNIGRCLAQRGLGVTLVPHTISLEHLLDLKPDGILLSNGPGDPETVTHLINLTKQLMERNIPMMGICLGHQIIGLAAGAKTSRLLFGHHGCNHPVIDVRTKKVTISSQNHNFQVDADSIPPESGFYVSHRNISDNSVEGLAHRTKPIFSVQYHPEAAPGPRDNRELFDQFAQMIREW